MKVESEVTPRLTGFDALRKQADFIERPEARIGLADRGYTAFLLRWAASQLEDGCPECNRYGESFL